MGATLAAGVRSALLIWTGVMFLPAWLVTVRGMLEGEDYAWGFTERVRGSGRGGYYFVAPLLAGYGLAVMALGWRGAARPFHLLLALWHIPLSIVGTLAARRNSDALRLQGDTLGVDVSLAAIAPVVLGGVAAGAAALPLIEGNAPRRARWTPRNTILLAAALAALPAQAILLRSGEQHGRSDKAGVALTMLQWQLFNVALAVRGRQA